MVAPARRVSARIGAITESATLAVDAKAKALKAAGRPVIGFGAGEPDFPTPDYIVEAAVAAARDPRWHRYTPAGGLPELKEAIAAKTLRDSGYAVDAAQVLVTNGGKQALYEAFATLLDPGDEVLAAGAVLDDLPGVDPARRRRTGRVVETDETTRLPRDASTQLEAARHPADQGAGLRLAVQPDRRRLSARAGRGDRRVGGRARPVGGHRRDLRAPDLRRRGVRLDADPGARAAPTSASSSTASRRRTP